MLVFLTNGPTNAVSKNTSGTGNIVMSAGPTLTGTIAAASQTLSGSLTVGTTLGVTGVATFTAAPVFSSATISTVAGFNASKNLVSLTSTGTGNVVLSASPTLTGTIVAASQTLSGSLTVGTTLGVTGIATFTASPVFNSIAATSILAIDAGKSLVAAPTTGTIGNVVLSISPTITGTLTAAIATLSGLLTLAVAPRFNGGNTTGAGSALLGANSPATTLTAPYTWFTVTTSDGSTGYIPVWK